MIRIERRESPACEADAQRVLEQLDTSPGAWLGCDVRADGLFRREAMACIDPSLAFYLDGRVLTVLARDATGAALLPVVAGLAGHQSPPPAATQGEATLTLAFGERGEAVVALLRDFLSQFSPASAELALHGIFSWDYYLLAPGHALPDDGLRRMVLFFPGRVLRTGDTGHAWVDFRFGGLAAVPAPRVVPEVPPVRATRTDDDLPEGGHAANVARATQLLAQGELYSLVLSQTLRRATRARASTAFGELRRANPYPAMFCLNLGGGEQVFGASPDLQVRADAQWIETAPVCGTFRRGADALEDMDQSRALLGSEVDEASISVCADSDRNDKARLCEPGSVELVSHRRVHFFATILHTIDHVRGRRRAGVDAFTILLEHATPPTVTGFPKARAIRAVDELEPAWRGWYAGAAARLGSDGSVEALTVLRAARLLGNGDERLAEIRSGGSLLADSDPQREEAETRLKALTLLRVLEGRSPRADAAPDAPARRLAVRVDDGQDPFAPMLRELLAQAGCDAVAGGTGAPLLLGEGANERIAHLAPDDAVVAVGRAGLDLLRAAGARTLALSPPQYGRTLEATPLAGTWLAGIGHFKAGIYAAQCVPATGMPAGWRVLATAGDGRVVAAERDDGRHIALLFRLESVNSLRGGAGRRILRAAVERLCTR